MSDQISKNAEAGAGKSAMIYDKSRKFNELIVLKINEGLKNGKLPWLPNQNGYCNVKAVKNAVTGHELTGVNQLLAKMHLQERGFDNDNILTFNQATKNSTSIRGGEKGFDLTFYDPKNNKRCFTRYFAESQTSNKDFLPYQSVKPKGEDFKQKSAEVQDYITNYLKCVSENRPFIVSKAIAKEFTENFSKVLQNEGVHVVYKVGNTASKVINSLSKQEIEEIRKNRLDVSNQKNSQGSKKKLKNYEKIDIGINRKVKTLEELKASMKEKPKREIAVER